MSFSKHLDIVFLRNQFFNWLNWNSQMINSLWIDLMNLWNQQLAYQSITNIKLCKDKCIVLTLYLRKSTWCTLYLGKCTYFSQNQITLNFFISTHTRYCLLTKMYWNVLNPNPRIYNSTNYNCFLCNVYLFSFSDPGLLRSKINL